MPIVHIDVDDVLDQHDILIAVVVVVVVIVRIPGAAGATARCIVIVVVVVLVRILLLVVGRHTAEFGHGEFERRVLERVDAIEKLHASDLNPMDRHGETDEGRASTFFVPEEIADLVSLTPPPTTSGGRKASVNDGSVLGLTETVMMGMGTELGSEDLFWPLDLLPPKKVTAFAVLTADRAMVVANGVLTGSSGGSFFSSMIGREC